MKVTVINEYDTETAIDYARTYKGGEYAADTIRALVAKIEQMAEAMLTPQPHRQRCERRKPASGEWTWNDSGDGRWFKWRGDPGHGGQWLVAVGATEMPKYPPACEPEPIP